MAAKKDTAPKTAAPAADKKAALETALAQIEKQFGKGAVMKLGANVTMQVDAIPTGSLGLDLALGIGGVPRGRIVEVYGPESSGKTTLALQILAEAQKMGGEVAFLMLSAAVGIFGISGTGVAQAQIIHELFLPMVQSLNIAMPIWGMVVLVGCQVTFFVTPTVDMVGQMGLARSKNIKAMLANGWVITVITFAYVLIRAILYTM